jgi:(E)-4-hydroxy-3-methyl-but-2-enyl pyrophosphate reductase
MRVYVPKHSGFCPGVEDAQRKILLERDKERKIAVLGHLIHNTRYLSFLEQRGIATLHDPAEIPADTVVAIRTHGLRRDQEAELAQRFELIDLTCPKVKQLQLYIQRHARQGCFVVITGKHAHPEVRGLVSYARRCLVVEREEDLEKWLAAQGREYPDLAGFRGVLVVSQTTGRREAYERTLRSLREALPPGYPVQTYDSICRITSLREAEALKLQKKVAVTFVVGDRLSSNANKLYNVLRQADERTYLVQDLDDLLEQAPDLDSCRAAQVVSSSSTPVFVEREIIRYLNDL